MEGSEAMHKGTRATRTSDRVHHAFGKRVAAGLSLLAVTGVTLGLVLFAPGAQAAPGLHSCFVVVGKHLKAVPLCLRGVTGATGHVGKTGPKERSARQEPPGPKAKKVPKAKWEPRAQRDSRARRERPEQRAPKAKPRAPAALGKRWQMAQPV